jgi:glycosyltransferase involved in cell wall biosynthesis
MAWVRKAAMLVLPSVRTATGRTEALGMALLEAAAAGVPAIGSRQGGIPEAIIDGETGFLAQERDVDGLAECMSKLLDNLPLRLRMGAHARALVERRFDIRRQTETLEGFYDAVLSGAKSGETGY